MTRLFRLRQPGIDYTESSIEWSADLKAAVITHLMDQPWRLYPASQPERARARLAELLGVDIDRIRFTSGADGAVDAAVRRASPAASLWIPAPAYPGYRRAASRHRSNAREYGARLTVEEISVLVGPGPAHVILTWPGNPIGTISAPQPTPSKSTSWTIDATYLSIFSAEFASLISRGEDAYDVIFSCSKVEGLAGVRLGGVILASKDESYGSDEFSFPLNTLQLAAAEVLLSPVWRDRITSRQNELRHQHARLAAALSGLGWTPMPSAAVSFVTVGDPIRRLRSEELEIYHLLHAKRFVDERLLRVTTCDHNIDSFESLLR